VVFHFAVGSSPESASRVSVPLDIERAGALCPDPLVVVVCFTSLRYVVNLKFARCEVPSISLTSTWRQPLVHALSVFQM
jgi:hypothetical protein